MASGVLHAAAAGDEAAVEAAVRKNRAMLEARDESGRTPLILAALHGRLGMVQWLLDEHADVEATDVGGRTAFLWAAAEGHSAVLMVLAQRTMEASVVTAETKSKNNALHRAAAYGQADAVRVLLSLGGNRSLLHTCNAAGETPLVRASRWGHREVVWCLLAHDADAGTLDASGRSAEDWGVEKGFSDVVEALEKWRDLGAGARDRAVREESEKQADVVEAAAKAIQADADQASRSAGAGGRKDSGEDDHDADEDDARAAKARGGGAAAAAAGGAAAKSVRVEGWMAKQGHIIPNWKNRWFVLEGRAMRYYGRQGDTTPKGEIILENGTRVSVEPSVKGAKPNCFTVHTPKKKFNLQAADEEERDEWVHAIQHNLKLAGPVPTASKFADD